MTAPGTDVAEVEAPGMEDIPAEVREFMPENIPAKAEAVEAEVAAAREKAESIVVDDQESAEAALEFVKAMKRQADGIKAERVSLTKPRKDAAEEIKRRYDDMGAPFLEVVEVVKATIGEWKAERDRKAAERQRAVEAEQQRIETEARAKREAAEQAEQEARELAEEDESPDASAIAEQLAAEARAEAESAAVVEDAIRAVPAGSPASAPALKGFSTPKRWVAEVTDITLLPDFLPDGTPLKAVVMSALSAYMHAVIKATGRPPEMAGAKFEQTTGSSVRT
jgi:colicin import membrane protein